MIGLLRAWRRRRLKRRAIPESWISYLQKNVAFFETLTDEQQNHFLDLLKIFVWEKYFIGAGGMEITDEVKVVVAAAAVRLILYLDLSYYDRLTEIIVYPSAFKHPKSNSVRLGEAHTWGIVVLSWPAVLEGLKQPFDGQSTAIHEFAHVMDRASGAFDGTPELHASEQYLAWATVMTHHFFKLRKGARKQMEAIDTYGAKDEAEFFAVVTETFYEKPELLRQKMPDLYQLLVQFYKYDPILNKGIE